MHRINPGYQNVSGMYMQDIAVLQTYGAAIRDTRKRLKRITANITTACRFLRELDRDMSGSYFIAKMEECVRSLRGYRNTVEYAERSIRADFTGIIEACVDTRVSRLDATMAEVRAATDSAELTLSVALSAMCTSKLP